VLKNVFLPELQLLPFITDAMRRYRMVAFYTQSTPSHTIIRQWRGPIARLVLNLTFISETVEKFVCSRLIAFFRASMSGVPCLYKSLSEVSIGRRQPTC